MSCAAGDERALVRWMPKGGRRHKLLVSGGGVSDGTDVGCAATRLDVPLRRSPNKRPLLTFELTADEDEECCYRGRWVEKLWR